MLGVIISRKIHKHWGGGKKEATEFEAAHTKKMRQQRTARKNERPQVEEKLFVWILVSGFCLAHSKAVRGPNTNQESQMGFFFAKKAKLAKRWEAVIRKGQSSKGVRKRRLGKAWGQQALNTSTDLEELIRPKEEKQHWINKVDAKRLPHICFMLLVFWSMSSTERIDRDIRE